MAGLLTLAEMPEEHIKEGDIDGLVGSPVVFNLAQHHLQPEHRAGRECGGTVGSMQRGKEAKKEQSTQPFSPNSEETMWGELRDTCPDSLPLMPHGDPRDRHMKSPFLVSGFPLSVRTFSVLLTWMQPARMLEVRLL